MTAAADRHGADLPPGLWTFRDRADLTAYARSHGLLIADVQRMAAEDGVRLYQDNPGRQQADADLAAARAEGGRTAQTVITAQADAGMGAGRIEVSAERVLADRFAAGATPQSAAFYDEYDRTAAMLTGELRDMEAGG